MKKIESEEEDDLQPEYELSRMKGGGCGRYVQRYRQETNRVLLDKTHRMLATVFLLLAVSATLSQTSRATNAVANRSWQSFWRQITAAVNKKDRVALRKMMPNDFFDGGGGLTPSEWLKFMDENERNGSWRDLQKSFAQGTVIHREWSAKGIPTRVTKDNGYYFEFRKDKRWYFAGVVGD